MGHPALEKIPMGIFDDVTSQNGVMKHLGIKGVLGFG